MSRDHFCIFAGPKLPQLAGKDPKGTIELCLFLINLDICSNISRHVTLLRMSFTLKKKILLGVMLPPPSPVQVWQNQLDYEDAVIFFFCIHDDRGGIKVSTLSAPPFCPPTWPLPSRTFMFHPPPLSGIRYKQTTYRKTRFGKSFITPAITALNNTSSR